ncbi:GAF domain-containing protein [Nakamurella sp.]|uniref:GAF domain-containing protein n=1 Tax=Nakamurella sp. TaxID=1869182 RepID=UPI003783B911
MASASGPPATAQPGARRPAAGPFLALPTGSNVLSERNKLERAYDAFLSTGDVASVRPVVADSWRLSRASGVSPDGVLPEVDLLDSELEAYRSAHPLAAVMPLIRRLLIEEAEEAGAIVVVADADARLLWVEGDATLRSRAEAMNWVAGARWDERTAGTNAPAAAMRLDHSLQVFAREHFASNVAGWSCTAAPIHDPTTGRVLGALDLTGRDDVAAPAVLGLVRAAAAAAETELRMLALTRRDAKPARRSTPKTPTLTGQWRLRVLGRDRAMLATRNDPAAGTELSVRHSELLFLLARHRSGYSADQLAVALHERDVPAVTVRAELSRLRALLPGLGLSGRPYRLTTHLATDVDAVRNALVRGDLAAAVAAYAGPILPSSESPEVQAERDALHRDLRAAVLGSGHVPAVLKFVNRPFSRDDILVWRHAVRVAPPSSRPVLVEHLLRIERELGGAPVRR